MSFWEPITAYPNGGSWVPFSWGCHPWLMSASLFEMARSTICSLQTIWCCLHFLSAFNIHLIQSCKSGRAFRVGPSSGVTCQNVSGPHTKLCHNIQSNIFFLSWRSFAHHSDFCKWSDCDFSSANSICKHSDVLLFPARISLTRFLRGRHPVA